jgi:epoxyqueuosine reductase QueG
MKMDLSNNLQALLKSEGASMIGFADLEGIPSDNRSELPLGISIGVALSPRIVFEIAEGPTDAYLEECFRLDAVLDKLGQKTVEILTFHGYTAKQQATTNTAGTKYPPNFTTALPHKTVATRAGLGWIGKCALLVTRQFGSAVRIGSVLTDADLTTGTPINASSCGTCTVCSDICPAHALSRKNWEVGMPRDSLVDVLECRKTARERLSMRIGREVVGRTFCGMCIAVCPWTKNYVETKKENNGMDTGHTVV